MSSLPVELWHDIVLQLPLKDIYNFLLSFNTKINWKDYFLYRTGIDEKMLKNFVIINKNSVIEGHVDTKLLDEYGLIKWEDYFIHQKIINNSIDKKFMIDHGKYLINKPMDIITQYFRFWPKLIALDLDKKTENLNKIRTINFSRGEEYFQTFFDRGFHVILYKYNSGKPIHRRRYDLSETYKTLKDILLNNNIVNINLVMIYDIIRL